MACRLCDIQPCVPIVDIPVGGGSYALNDYSFEISCPAGAFCPGNGGNGVIIIPGSMIPPVVPPPVLNGQPIVLRLVACNGSTIIRTLAAGATQAQIKAAAASMQAEWAAAQALCYQTSPPTGGIPNSPINPGPVAPVPIPPATGGGRVDVQNAAQTATCASHKIGSDVTVPAGTYKAIVFTAGMSVEDAAAAVAVAQANLDGIALQSAQSQLVCHGLDSFSWVISDHPGAFSWFWKVTNNSATDFVALDHLKYDLPAPSTQFGIFNTVHPGQVDIQVLNITNGNPPFKDGTPYAIYYDNQVIVSGVWPDPGQTGKLGLLSLVIV